MTVAQRQQSVVEAYALIENKQERLGAIVDTARTLPPFSESERIAEHLVPGCTSRVWLRAELRDDTCHFTTDCDSPMVKGLVHLICECCEGLPPAEVARAEISVIEALGLWRDLSGTRQNGLRAVAQRIRQHAVAFAAA
ncbi:SufE family protein [Actomonas aquatica]|uniref:SufE family protein n=1 Tax=Actomonas aquatica TaxID=2866162 RepID=A0ABZ1CDL2_9BACT|nr:SufE family protein [Opitutus sp. WL0086]WRQ89691.1 SufE family protein [Opitutus sp. WL0086]